MTVCGWEECTLTAYGTSEYCVKHLQEIVVDTRACLEDLERVARAHAAFDAYLVAHGLPREAA